MTHNLCNALNRCAHRCEHSEVSVGAVHGEGAVCFSKKHHCRQIGCFGGSFGGLCRSRTIVQESLLPSVGEPRLASHFCRYLSPRASVRVLFEYVLSISASLTCTEEFRELAAFLIMSSNNMSRTVRPRRVVRLNLEMLQPRIDTELRLWLNRDARLNLEMGTVDPGSGKFVWNNALPWWRLHEPEFSPAMFLLYPHQKPLASESFQHWSSRLILAG